MLPIQVDLKRYSKFRAKRWKDSLSRRDSLENYVPTFVITPYRYRVLHVFEALPYSLAAVLCVRQRKLGYILGTASGGFWLWMAGTQTSFVRNGFERLTMLITTGHVDRWEQFIAAPAALATGGLVVFSLWGHMRLPTKQPVDLVRFGSAVATVALFFAVIFWLFAPQYLTLFRRLIA